MEIKLTPIGKIDLSALKDGVKQVSKKKQPVKVKPAIAETIDSNIPMDKLEETAKEIMKDPNNIELRRYYEELRYIYGM